MRQVTILGAPDKIMDMAAGMQLDLSRATLIDPEQYPHLQASASTA